MAIQVTSSEELKAEINVTPLVDVVLVLLIIFMVVTPLLKQELPIELPIADTSQAAADVSQVTISLAADGRALVNGVEAPAGELAERLTALYAGRTDKTIYLEADRALPHGRVVDLMDDVRAAGVVRIGVVTKRDPASQGPLAPTSSASQTPAADAVP
jgi:biopolymer transport protein ExbD